MDFEDKLRARFARADASIADERLNHNEVVGRGKRLRTMRFATIATAAAIVVGGAAFVSASPWSSGRGDTPPVGPSIEPTDDTDDPTPPPGSDRTFAPKETSDECSGGQDAHAGSYLQGMPEEVNEIRREIISATWKCDYERLEELALRPGDTFEYATYGNPPPPAEVWRELEEGGEPIGMVTKYMARLLETTPMQVNESGVGATFIWPSAAISDTPSDVEWDELENVYEKSMVDEMRRNGEYLGYRLEIDETGDWTVFMYQEPSAGVPGSKLASFTPGETSDECSGSRDAHTGYEQRGLPRIVNEVRRDIITRTWTCDYEALEEIALFHKNSPFEHKIGDGPDDPSEYWRQLEAAGDPLMRILVDALESEPTLRDHTSGEAAGKVDIYIWRSQGYEVHITSEGDWVRFSAH
jgi:hypothetical protein